MPGIVKEEDLRERAPKKRATKSSAPAELNENQKKIFEAMKSQPELQKVLTCIFRDYPSVVIKTFQFGGAHATKAQRMQLPELNKVKLKMETYIEETIAVFSGVELD
ncbi:hypothetical protein DRO61_05375 [Candidatus Bathyarchaeota archaeon]|nr:MAG: hypothetical protein DRO61_05375 [Candidatus Bathyarchaeota archaeon]